MYDNVILITTKKKIAAFLKGNKQLFLVAITGSVRLIIPMGETNVAALINSWHTHGFTLEMSSFKTWGVLLCSWTRHLQFNSHSAIVSQ